MWRLLCVSLALLICVKDSLSRLEEFGHPFLNPRIIGGIDTNAKSWPWMVSLNYDNGKHFCGGSLITNEWVLTAAHCVEGEDKSSIRAHLGKTQQEGDDPNVVIMGIKEIIIHDKYDENTSDNDIALLRLSATVAFTEHIKTVSLADQNSVFVAKTKSWITGWGHIREKTLLPSPGTLKVTTVEVFNNKECSNLCRTKVTDNMICAGTSSGGRGQAKGDSGGPMVSQWCSLWVQSGVIVWDVKCAQPNVPDGYTRVSKYRQWIEDNIHENLPGFISFPPDLCSHTSLTSTSCSGRCNEKYDDSNFCNCNADCKTKCCNDYKQQCDA